MKQKISLIILALLILLPSCKSPSSPSSPDTDGVTTTGTISGTVTDANTGNPIAGASVSTQPTTLLVTTDAQGRFSISNVTPGSYTVTASASGYFDESANITVTAGQTSTADLALQADYSGSWSGSTSQGYGISFTIVDNAITEISFGFKTVGPICTLTYAWGLTIGYPTPKSISGNTFTISGSVTDLTYTFIGTFDSTTTASGTAEFTHGGNCPGTGSATWSVNKD